ncbi:hypothetical protein FOZ63_010934, partial [Perkinsus olseni]
VCLLSIFMCRQDSPPRPSRSPRPLQLVDTAGKDLHHFLQHHFEYVSPKADKIWHRSTVVGFSCFLLAMITGPAFILQHCFFGALVCLTESLTSFAADYVFIEDDTHPAQRIDRYMCVVFVAVTWYDCIVGLRYSVSGLRRSWLNKDDKDSLALHNFRDDRSQGSS